MNPFIGVDGKFVRRGSYMNINNGRVWEESPPSMREHCKLLLPPEIDFFSVCVLS